MRNRARCSRVGLEATKRFFEFFTVPIRNKNTRIAYYHAIGQFLDWRQKAGFRHLEDIEPIHVAAYIEGHSGSAATIKQHRLNSNNAEITGSARVLVPLLEFNHYVEYDAPRANGVDAQSNPKDRCWCFEPARCNANAQAEVVLRVPPPVCNRCTAATLKLSSTVLRTRQAVIPGIF